MMLPSAYPVTPPRNENQPTLELFSPIAWSRPCTGYGVNTSHFLNPASRTFSAACMVAAGVSNSAIRPYGFPVSGMSGILSECKAGQGILTRWFPLTLTLSLREREQPCSIRGKCEGARLIPAVALFLSLPKGEG